MSLKQTIRSNDYEKQFLNAAMFGQLGKLKKLIKQKKASVNTKNEDGIDALSFTITHEHPKCFEYLISKKAAINLTNMLGITALMCAITTHSKIKIIKKLLKNGANVNLKDACGWSAFHSACMYGYREAVIEMLKYNADINTTNNNGQDPLDSAIVHKQKVVIEILLENGSEVQKINSLKDIALKDEIIKNFNTKLSQKILEAQESINQDLTNLVISYLL